MNKPKATRLGLCMAIAAIAAFAVFVPVASADVNSTVTGEFLTNVTSGGHGDYRNTQSFTYDDFTTEDLRKWVVDSPAGLVGNPNAIPYAERCSTAQFNAFVDPGGDMVPPFFNGCPLSSKVGVAAVALGNDVNNGSVDANGGVNAPTRPTGNIQDFGGPLLAPTFANGVEFASLPAAYNDATPGTIYILQTEPEIPTTLGTFFYFTGNKTKSTLAPVTNQSGGNNGDSDFRIRTVPQEDITPTASVHINGILQHLNGSTQAAAPFLTNPARCDAWTSYSYVDKVGGNANGNSSPAAGEGNVFRKSPGDDETPDCSTVAPFGTTASASISTGERGAYPGLTVKVADPSPIGHDQVKTMVTTLPAATSVNVNALNNVCSDADRLADTCPAASKVGTASIKTPLISAGLSGRVYMTKGSVPGLPALSIYADGAIKFRLDASTRFVGAAFNQIEATLVNLPQTPFTDFTVNIEGGSSQSSLFFNRSCPTDGTAPTGGSTEISLTGYANPTTTSSSANSYANCYGISKPSRITNCVKIGKTLKVTPKGIVSKPTVAKVTLRTGSSSSNQKTRATDKKETFTFKLSMKKSKYKAGKVYRYSYKVYYKDGNTVKTKTNTFKTCKK